MGANNSIQQHEPLRVPDAWKSSQEKKFVHQLEEILDDLYKRFNRLRMEDLGDALRRRIISTETTTEGLEERVRNAELAITPDAIVTTVTDSTQFKALSDEVSAAQGTADTAQEAADAAAALAGTKVTSSEMIQTATDIQNIFREIGLAGEKLGIVTANQNGVKVEHSDIGGYTQMSADGFRVYDENGRQIGGTVVIDGVVYVVAKAFTSPSTPGFRIGVVERDFEGEQMGLHWIFDGNEKGSISAFNTGMRQDVNGSFAIYPSKQFQVSADEGFYIYGPDGTGISVEDDGYMTLAFTYFDSSGNPSVRRLSAQYIYDVLSSISSD